MWKPKFYLQFYALGKIKITLAAGQELPFEFNMPGDAEFLMEEIQVVANNSAGDTTHIVMKLDDTTDRSYTNNQFVTSNYFNNSGSGHAERPINMNIPFRRNSTLTVTLKNLSANPITDVVLSIFGRKNYSEESFYIE